MDMLSDTSSSTELQLWYLYSIMLRAPYSVQCSSECHWPVRVGSAMWPSAAVPGRNSESHGSPATNNIETGICRQRNESNSLSFLNKVNLKRKPEATENYLESAHDRNIHRCSTIYRRQITTMADQIQELLDTPAEFTRDGIQFMKRCTKRRRAHAIAPKPFD